MKQNKDLRHRRLQSYYLREMLKSISPIEKRAIVQ